MAPTRWLWKLIHILDLQIHMYTLNNLNVMLVLYVMFEVCSLLLLLLLLQSTICCRFNLNLNLHAAFES